MSTKTRTAGILILMSFVLGACGGGGSGGTEPPPPPITSALEFEQPSTFANGSAYVTQNASTSISGGLNSAATPRGLCPNGPLPQNYSARWRNTANSSSGTAPIGFACITVGGLPGIVSHFATATIALEVGDNQIVFETFEGNTQIGRDTVVIVREAAAASLNIQTTEGIYQGLLEGSLRVFRGLRYAAAPTGDRRFKAPEAPPAFTGISDATQFGANCFQPSSAGPIGEEDCLFMNIWTHNDNLQRPVLVFLHGGGSNNVGGDMATTDGVQLAEDGNIIVVTLNRRISILGSLALEELRQESAQNTTGNYQVQDVLAALRWLRDNVAVFNGDPQRIMLVGESAGARLVCHILATTEAAGLISAAVMQSAACGIRTRLDESVAIFSPFDTALNLHRPVVAAAGCDNAADVLQCLRDLPAADILSAAADTAAAAGRSNLFGPIVDGVLVTTDPHTALQNEIAGSIPVIVGATANEGGGGLSGTPPADDAEYRTRLTNIFGSPNDEQIYALYPTADFASVEDAWITFWGDWIFNCVAEELARSAAGNAPAYLYQFSRGLSTGSRAGLGAVHAIDVPFLFGTFDVFGHTPDTDDATVVAAMRNAWTGLASDPTAAPPYLPSGSSAWPAFDAIDIRVVNFDAPVTVDVEHRAGRCETFRTIIQF